MLRIGELAELANVSKRTIDYYTTLGLIKAERSASNYRFYNEDTLKQLQIIQQYKQEHLSLEKIKERLALIDRCHDDSQEKVVKKIEELLMEIREIEEEVLKLNLEKLDNEQLQSLGKHLNSRSSSLIQTLFLVFGEQVEV